MPHRRLATVVCLATLAVPVAACHGTPGSPVATPTTRPPGVQHSSVADVFVPPNATLVPAEDTAPGAERWEMKTTGYPDAVAQEEALLPVGKALDGYPWCRKRPVGYTADNTTWVWGGPRDAVVVSVFDEANNSSLIVVRHGSCA
jgi:hypothetical protein